MSSRRAAACWWFRNLRWRPIPSGDATELLERRCPDRAEALYEYFVARCRQQEMHTQTGRFAADMQVSLVNDGPVTFWLQV